MLILAHRGFHAVQSENTIGAFEAAQKLGVDGIETDVRLSADGKPVIMHDRVTPAGRAVSSLTHRELEQEVGYEVPVLEEILEAFPSLLWNIEIKHPESWPAASAVLAKYQASRRILVSSFRHDVVYRCAEELEIDCALLIANRPLEVDSIVAACSDKPRIRSIVWDYNILDDSMLRAMTAYGWNNYVYGALTSGEHARCAGLGLCGLITDHPQRAGTGE